MLFLQKDRSLAVPLLEGILKYWPFAYAQKEIIFITAMSETLEVIDIEKMKPMVKPLCKKMIFYMESN